MKKGACFSSNSAQVEAEVLKVALLVDPFSSNSFTSFKLGGFIGILFVLTHIPSMCGEGLLKENSSF